MFDWFSPKCPLGTAEKYWAETRMQWLADVLGIDRLIRTKVLLPADMNVPESFSGTSEEMNELMLLLMDHMEIRNSKISLKVCDQKEMPNAAGMYVHYRDTKTILISNSIVSDPGLVVATLAHELSHEILLGGGLLHPDDPDHELLTDLLTVYLGVGVIMANSTTRESNQNLGGGWYYWKMSRLGYLPVRIYGYALALFANYRGETKPVWADHLRRNASVPFRKGLNYVRKTSDCLFQPESKGTDLNVRTTENLLAMLKTGTSTFRLAALMKFEERNEHTAEVVEAVIGSLGDRDTTVGEQAVKMAARFVPEARRSIELIVDALHSPDESLRATAAETLGLLAHRPELVVGELQRCLKDECRNVVIQSIVALSNFGRAASKCESKLAKEFSEALFSCDYEISEYLAAALLAVSEDPRQQVREQFSPSRPELIEMAFEAIERNARSKL